MEGGEKKEKEEMVKGGRRICEKHNFVLCSLLHILIFLAVLKAISIAADSEMYCLDLFS